MYLPVKLAWRNIFREKRRTLLTVFTMTGGFFLASVSIGWMKGSYENMIMFFTSGRTGQIQVHGEGYLDDRSIYNMVEDYRSLGEAIGELEEVEGWAPRIYAGGLLASRGENTGPGIYSNSAGAAVIGIDPVLEEGTMSFSNRLVEGEMLSGSPADSTLYGPGQIILGRELAIMLDVATGDSLVLFSQAVDGGSADRKYCVTGIVSTGSSDFDRSSAYISLADAQILYAMGNSVHEIAVTTGSLGPVEKVSEEIAALAGDRELSVSPWQVFAAEFYNGMQADEASLRIVLGIIIGMAALGVLNTILMMVLERRREFGVMKAIGTRPGSIVKMLVLEANIMGFFSIILGSLLATAGLLFFSSHGWVLDPPLDFGGFTFREMLATITPECYWIPAVIVIITASVVSLLPALKAARTDPARSLRMN